MALAVMQTGTGQLLDVPTGNGFCLFIKREVFDQIGLFDEVLFPRGYGEENEFCMRAAEQGWMNVVSDKVFVSHEGSSSFGEEKLELTRIGLERVQAKFPTYAILNKRIFDEEFHSFRSRVFNRLIGPVPKRRILFIQPISGGGLPFTNDDLSKGISDDLEQLRLTLNSQSNWQLERKSGGIWQFLEEEFRLVNPIASADSAFDSWFADLVFRFSVDIIHLEHSQWFSSTALRAAKPLVSCVTMSIHDYYSICPSTQLLDENLISCGGVCTKSQGQCSTPIDFAIEFPPLKDNFVHSWRSRQDAIFKTLDCIFGPTQSSLSRIGKFFDISSIQRVVVPHGRDDLSPTNRELNMSAGNAILVLGAIGLHKGAQLLPDLVHELGKYDIRVDLLGTTSKQFESTSFRNLGDYQRGEIERGVNPADYAFVLLPSIWEETFAHTISEAWSLGLPVVGFSLGAMEERLAGGGGRVLPLDLKDNAKLLASELKEIAADTKSLERMRLEAGRLATEIRKRSSRAMALDYLEVWNRLVK
jgi:glycosyltransferase involved in cell wall biosynthesis